MIREAIAVLISVQSLTMSEAAQVRLSHGKSVKEGLRPSYKTSSPSPY